MPLFAEVASQIVAVHLREAGVQQEYIGSEVGAGIQGSGGGNGDVRSVAPELQEGDQGRGAVRVILHQKDTQHGA